MEEEDSLDEMEEANQDEAQEGGEQEHARWRSGGSSTENLESSQDHNNSQSMVEGSKRKSSLFIGQEEEQAFHASSVWYLTDDHTPLTLSS